eukprot:scaffold2989_cov387-Prasinococcus_capsulatus_cf.AAC.7
MQQGMHRSKVSRHFFECSVRLSPSSAAMFYRPCSPPCCGSGSVTHERSPSPSGQRGYGAKTDAYEGTPPERRSGLWHVRPREHATLSNCQRSRCHSAYQGSGRLFLLTAREQPALIGSSSHNLDAATLGWWRAVAPGSPRYARDVGAAVRGRARHVLLRRALDRGGAEEESGARRGSMAPPAPTRAANANGRRIATSDAGAPSPPTARARGAARVLRQAPSGVRQLLRSRHAAIDADSAAADKPTRPRSRGGPDRNSRRVHGDFRTGSGRGRPN